MKLKPIGFLLQNQDFKKSIEMCQQLQTKEAT